MNPNIVIDIADMKKLIMKSSLGEILRITSGVTTAIATLIHPIKMGPNLERKKIKNFKGYEMY